MKKQYKLIKLYPGSIKLGETITQSENKDFIFLDKNGRGYLLEEDIKSFLDLWQEVTELCITEDGFPLYANENYYVVIGGNNDIINCLSSAGGVYNNTTSVKRFKYYTNAQKYKDDNKIHQCLVKESNIKVGDYVKVVAKANSYERGWKNGWVDEMDIMVNKIGKVVSIRKDEGVEIDFGEKQDCYYEYPIFVLEKTEPSSNSYFIVIYNEEIAKGWRDGYRFKTLQDVSEYAKYDGEKAINIAKVCVFSNNSVKFELIEI